MSLYDRDKYRGYVRDLEPDIGWTLRKTFWRLIVPVMVLGLAVFIAGRVLGWFGSAVQMATEQTDPAVMLKRYEWFKDAAAALDKKQADIQIYEKRFQDLKAEYGSTPRKEWAREDREQWSVWQSEVAGIKASYNGLAAEYNANMAKANYAFTNVGQLPKGAERPLPREYKPYETN